MNRPVERGLFNYSPDRISPIKTVIVWSILCEFVFAVIPVENFFVDSKSFPVEAIGI